MKICIIAKSAAYGNAAVLAEGLKKYCQVEIVFHYRDEKQMYPAEIRKDVPKCDHYIIMGAVSLGLLPKRYYRRATIILTDSTYMYNPKKYNAIFRIHGFNVWAMPDLAPLGGFKNIYYQPFIIPEVDRRKVDLICHSPYCKEKQIQKGTSLIAAICAKNNLPLTIITGKTWQQTIEIKARHLICVDQLIRGIGKSGLEAMLLDSVVLSGIKPAGNHLPPIVWTNKKRLENDLLELIFDKKKQNEVIERQRQWAKINLDPQITAKKILDTI